MAKAIELTWTSTFVDSLVSDLSVLKEPRIRALALADRLAPLTSGDWISIVNRVHSLAVGGHDQALFVLACFRDSQAFCDKLGRARMVEAATEARERNEHFAAELLRPIEERTGGGAKTHRDLRELTLGERKALARSPKKDMLVKLLQDDHPQVQALLLSNPRLTAREVVNLAAKRPASAPVLRGIALHARWMHDPDVRRALAKNPDTPLDVSGRLMTTLMRGDLAEVVENEGLHPTLRHLAREQLRLLAPIVLEVADNDEYVLTPEEMRALGLLSSDTVEGTDDNMDEAGARDENEDETGY